MLHNLSLAIAIYITCSCFVLSLYDVVTLVTFYISDDAFTAKANLVSTMFSSILAIFFLRRKMIEVYSVFGETQFYISPSALLL